MYFLYLKGKECKNETRERDYHHHHEKQIHSNKSLILEDGVR